MKESVLEIIKLSLTKLDSGIFTKCIELAF